MVNVSVHIASGMASDASVAVSVSEAGTTVQVAVPPPVEQVAAPPVGDSSDSDSDGPPSSHSDSSGPAAGILDPGGGILISEHGEVLHGATRIAALRLALSLPDDGADAVDGAAAAAEPEPAMPPNPVEAGALPQPEPEAPPQPEWVMGRDGVLVKRDNGGRWRDARGRFARGPAAQPQEEVERDVWVVSRDGVMVKRDNRGRWRDARGRFARGPADQR